MKVRDFDYELPPERIAQHPCEPREAARLLVHGPGRRAPEHRRIGDLPEVLKRGDLLVVNDTKVLPARLCGKRRSGGAVELLLLGPLAGEDTWRAYARPAGKLRAGERLELEEGALEAELVARPPRADGSPGPEWHLRLRDPAGRSDVPALLERAGRMPLPPYIRREVEDPFRERDRSDYQTSFAREPGAVAAPTAGLHFTPALLEQLEAAGVERATVTLHVGPGTFRPVTTDDADEHEMHTETFVLPEATVAAVERCRAAGGRVVCVGTTTLRVLESCKGEDGGLVPRAGETDIFIRPGHAFGPVDGLLTNFHLPRSTLLMLVSAWSERETVMGLYAQALEEGYRFYSYGDAMLLWR